MADWEPNQKLREHPIKEFFVRKGVSLSCSSCGSDDWVVSEPADSVPVVNYWARDEWPFSIQRGTSVYLLYCQNCGYLRMYDRKHVDEGLRGAGA